MQTSQDHHSVGGVHGFYHQHAQDMVPYLSFGSMYPDNAANRTQMSFQAYDQAHLTPDSSAPAVIYNLCGSPSVISTSSNRCQYSPQGSQSYVSDPRHSADNNYGSPLSGSSVVDDDADWKNQLRFLEHTLLGPDSSDSYYCSLTHIRNLEVSSDLNQIKQMVPKLDLERLLNYCAQVVENKEVPTAEIFMDELGKRVSVSGTPTERLGAYVLEGLRARLEESGFTIYKKLRCEKPTNSELLSYMGILYKVCPYYQFAYKSSNLIIEEAMQSERSIHIIDFQIAMGTQWTLLFESLAKRPGGPPLVRITGVDDEHSAHARGGGLEVVGRRLAESARSFGVPFQFHAAAMSGYEVELENLSLRPFEGLAVNFPYMLHHMPDEGVSTANHRDRLLRLVKGLSPRIVTLVEQESNTNTPPFMQRFKNTLKYYTAMFESIDVALPRDEKTRINAEMHCVARDIVNMIACEDEMRVERHDPFKKWQSRLKMAGFTQLPLSDSVKNAMYQLLSNFHQYYNLLEESEALYLRWKNCSMATTSAWR